MYFRNIVTYDIRDQGKWKKYQPHKTYTYHGTHTVTVSSLLFYLLIGKYYELNNPNVYGSCLQDNDMIYHNDMTLLSLSRAFKVHV